VRRGRARGLRLRGRSGRRRGCRSPGCGRRALRGRARRRLGRRCRWRARRRRGPRRRRSGRGGRCAGRGRLRGVLCRSPVPRSVRLLGWRRILGIRAPRCRRLRLVQWVGSPSLRVRSEPGDDTSACPRLRPAARAPDASAALRPDDGQAAPRRPWPPSWSAASKNPYARRKPGSIGSGVLPAAVRQRYRSNSSRRPASSAGPRGRGMSA